MLISSQTPPPRDTIRAGFYFALGVTLLVVLALAARRFLEATLDICAPFVVGLILALMLDPVADRMTRRGLSRTVAAGIVFGIFLLLIVGIGWLTVPRLITQAGNLAQNGPGYVTIVQAHVKTFLATHHKIGPLTLPATVEQLTDQFSGRASAFVQQASGSVYDFLVGSVMVVIQMVLALIVAFFLLVDIDRLRARLFYLAPEKWRGLMGQLGSDVGGVFSDYLRGLLIVCALYGAATIGLLYLLSVWHPQLAQYALLVGAAAGALYAVPYLGSATSALVIFLVAFAAGSEGGHSGLAFAGLAVALTLVVNQIFDNVVTPRVVGGGVGLHPVLALFALVIGGALFQLSGMLLSVPIAGSIQVILFRLFPHLTAPTPAGFLRAQGVPLDQRESVKILEGDQSVTAERQQAEKEAEAPPRPR